jgi:ADP-ribose pyrophosphatase YjhB (NUDIX family)
MKFCSDCGGVIEQQLPPNDDRQRSVCASCNKVHYQNPLVVVGCLVERGDEILLCRRAIEPAHGKWTIPAGYLELGETMAKGACRETLEEAGAKVEIVAPLSQLELTHIGQVHMTFRARMSTGTIAPGVESIECAFVHPDQIPWQDLAFPVGHFALRLLLDDRQANQQHLHTAQLSWNQQGSRFDAQNYTLESYAQIPIAK